MNGYPVKQLNWDTQLFGIRMGEVELGEERPDLVISIVAWRRTLELAREQGFQFLFCQFDVEMQELANLIIGIGGTIGDILLTLKMDPVAIIPGNISEEALAHIYPATEEDLPEILAIAGSSFELSRIIQDRRFDPTKSRQFYPRWIFGRFGVQEKYFVFKDKQAVQGFIALNEPTDGKGSISLIAVNSASLGQGVGRALVGWAIASGVTQGLKQLRVGTQINNYPATRLYEKSGFRMERAKYRFHIWLDPAVTTSAVGHKS